MAFNIPMPSLDRSGLFEGLVKGREHRQQQEQMAQQWQEHLRNAAIREMQEKRLNEQLAMQQQLHPYELFKAEEEKRRAPKEYEALEAKIEHERAQSESLKRGGNQRISAAIQEADAIYNGDRDNPGWKQYVSNKSKVYLPNEQQVKEDEQLKQSPEYAEIEPYMKDAVDMGFMPVASQNFYRKEMNTELGQIDKAKQVKHAIAQAREITKNNPQLYRKAVNIIVTSDGNAGKIEKALTGFFPEKDVEAIKTAGKLYADILTKQAQLNNMSRSVYALKLQERAKAQVTNPDETNEQIFRNLEQEIEPQIAREKAIKYAIKHNMYLPYSKNYQFEEQGEPNQVPNAVNSPTQMGMMKGIDSQGKEVDVHPSRRAQFEQAGGRIL